MKDEKDILLDDFFKEAAELQIEDNGFSERVISALPQQQKLRNQAVERLRKKVRLLEIVEHGFRPSCVSVRTGSEHRFQVFAHKRCAAYSSHTDNSCGDSHLFPRSP